MADACHKGFFAPWFEYHGFVTDYAEFVNVEGEEDKFICFS